jgi:hypothetical protein
MVAFLHSKKDIPGSARKFGMSDAQGMPITGRRTMNNALNANIDRN